MKYEAGKPAQAVRLLLDIAAGVGGSWDMLRRIRDLDLDDLMARVIRATDVRRGTSSDWLIQSALQRTRSDDRVLLLHTKVALAALVNVQLLEDLTIERPLVEALVRVHHHPRAQAPLPKIELATGVDAGPRLNAITAEHPELEWDVDRVQTLLAQAIRENGDHQLDDTQPPWLMNFGKADAAAHTLWTFVTLRALGDLDRR